MDLGTMEIIQKRERHTHKHNFDDRNMEETVEFEKLEILYTSVILFLIESISVLGRYSKCWSHGKYFFIKNKATPNYWIVTVRYIKWVYKHFFQCSMSLLIMPKTFRYL